MNFGGGYGEATLSGVISGTGGLSISQDGTIFNPQQPLTFSGSNTYTGITKITGGISPARQSGALAGSTLDYSSSNGGVLSFGSQTSAVSRRAARHAGICAEQHRYGGSGPFCRQQ